MEAKWRWILVAAIAPIAWGSNYYVTRQLLPESDPFWGAALRALPAGTLLALIARRTPRGSWWWKSLVLGALNVGAFFVLIYLASHLLPTSIAATIMSASAVVLLLLAWPLLAERPTAFGVIGAVLGVAGDGLVLAGDTAAMDARGVAASLAAMLMSSLGFVLTKKWAPGESTIAVTSWQLLGGGLLLGVVACVVEGPPPAPAPAAIAGFAYVSLVATALAFVAWFAALRHLPAGAVGLVGLLNPVTGVLLGAGLAAERLALHQVLGIGVVVGGVLVGQYRGRRSVAV